MLVARRDPPFQVDVHDPVPANPYPALKASKLTRFVTAVQMVGSLLAVPVGIASAYSFYRANFSPETTCQGLRSGIVAMLDKSVDAATRRILVRRDVETFEKTCGTVDPEATAAFKSLLASEKTASVPVAAPAVPKPQRNEAAAPKEQVRRIEPRPQMPAKQPAVATTNVVAEPQRRDTVISDTQWLDAVRQALVTHKEQTQPAHETAKTQPVASPVVRPAPHESAAPSPPAAVASTPPVVPSVAPVLPPAMSIAPPPAAADVRVDHPVPPETIPDSAPPANADTARPNEHARSRIGKWISAIPLLGPAVDNARQ
jgi:hypothetical protein